MWVNKNAQNVSREKLRETCGNGREKERMICYQTLNVCRVKSITSRRLMSQDLGRWRKRSSLPFPNVPFNPTSSSYDTKRTKHIFLRQKWVNDNNINDKVKKNSQRSKHKKKLSKECFTWEIITHTLRVCWLDIEQKGHWHSLCSVFLALPHLVLLSSLLVHDENDLDILLFIVRCVTRGRTK